LLESAGRKCLAKSIKGKKGFLLKKSPYIIAFIELNRHLEMETLT
jgi:hypothetical protein